MLRFTVVIVLTNQSAKQTDGHCWSNEPKEPQAKNLFVNNDCPISNYAKIMVKT